MARDGTLAVVFARHSFFGLNDTRATYDLLEAQARNRDLLWVIGGLAGALALTLWLAWSLRRARQATERARTLLEGAVGELEKRNAELERFTYTVSHDLRSPLVTVMGFLGAVEDGRGQRADRARCARTWRGSAARPTRMDRLLEELLELSRVGRARPPEPETVPFAELVARGERARRRGACASAACVLEVAPGPAARARRPAAARRGAPEPARQRGQVHGRPAAPARSRSARAPGDGHAGLLRARQRHAASSPATTRRCSACSTGSTRRTTGTGDRPRAREAHRGAARRAGLGRVRRAPGAGSTFCFTLPQADPVAAPEADAAPPA